MTDSQSGVFNNNDLVEKLRLSPVIVTQLSNAGIFTIQDLLDAQRRNELITIKDLDGKSINEIDSRLENIRLVFTKIKAKIPEHSTTTGLQLGEGSKPSYHGDLLEELNLSRKVFNALRRAGVKDIGSLVNLIERGALLNVDNLGEKGENEVKSALEAYLSSNTVVDLQSPEKDSKENSIISFSDLDSVRYLDNLSINFLQVFLSAELVDKLISVNVSSLGDLSTITRKYLNFLIPSAQVIDKSVNSAVHIIKNKIKLGSIHPKVVIDGLPVEKLLNIQHDSDAEKMHFLTVVNNIFKYSSLDEEIRSLLVHISPRDLRVFLSYCLDDKTYDEIGDDMGITRERIRQIYSKTYQHISASLSINPKIYFQTALFIADDLGDELCLSSWLSSLINNKVLTNEVKYEGFSSFDIMCAILSNKNIEKKDLYISPNILLVISSESDLTVSKLIALSMISNQNKRDILKIISFTGGIERSQASEILGCSLDESTTILSLLGYSEVQPGWFTISLTPSSRRFPLITCLFVMLQACGPLHFEKFSEGLSRYISRHYNNLAPDDVLKHVLLLSGFQINNEIISYPERVSGYLSDSEVLFLRLIAEKGQVVSYQEIIEFYLSNHFSQATATVRIMGQSPIVERIDTGFYILRGHSITSQDLENAKSRQEAYEKDPIVFTDPDGITRYQLTIGSWSLGGTLNICRTCQPLPDFSEGWDIFVSPSNQKHGKITHDDFFIWGLSPAFTALSIQIGDRVELAFIPGSEPKVVVSLVKKREQ